MKFEFSDEERRVIRECKNESFWYRCVPFSFTLAVGVHYATTAGYLKTYSKFGNVARLVGVTCLGYALGKFSYIRKCRDKLLALPNSRLAERIRNQKYNQEVMPDSHTNTDQFGTPTSSAIGVQHRSDDGGRDYDTHHSNNVTLPGLEDRHRPSLDTNESKMSNNERDQQIQPRKTFEELRKQNRASYSQPGNAGDQQAPRDFGRQPWPQPQQLGKEQPIRRQQPKDSAKPTKNVTKYGDEME